MGAVFEQFGAKKAFEIAYAVFRISSRLPDRQFADVLEKKALALLDAATDSDFRRTSLSIDALVHFLQLGASLGLMHSLNSETIINEIQVLRQAIAGAADSRDVEAVNLEGFFTVQEPQLLDDVIQKTAPKKQTVTKKEGNQNLSAPREDDQLRIRAKMRQSAILERIRQSGNCRIKELQDFLPDLSDRSLRYDLQALIEQGAIERVGNGPSTFYRVHETEELPSGPHPLELLGNQ